MRCNVFVYGILIVEVIINLLFFVYLKKVWNINLNGSVTKCFHEFVVGQLFKLSIIGMTKNNFINWHLIKTTWFNTMFLSSTKQVIQKLGLKFKNFLKLNKSTIGYQELSVKVKCTWITFTSVFCQLTIINISGQFSCIL